MTYITAADVKQHLGQNTPTTEDDLISDLIDQAQAVIESYCGGKPPRKRIFEASGDTTRTYNALGDVIGSTLYLHTDICAVTTVSNNGSTVSAANYKLLSDNVPNAAPYNRIKLLSTTWGYTTNPEDAASITGRFAYSTTPPNDIKLACIELVIAAFRQRDTVAGVFAAMTGENGAVMFPDGMPKRVIDKLEPYVWR